jgi:hypothetical protein
MGNTYFFKFIILFIISLALFAFVRTIYDNDDPGYDTLCINNDIFSYGGLFADVLLMKSIFYGYNNDAIYFEPVLSYLARQEKSPPVTIMPTVIF